MTTHVAVIGAGPAGIAAAKSAAKAGARVTLIGAEPPGGRAGWHSLLPSKVLLTASDKLGAAQHFPVLGLSGDAPAPDIDTMTQRIHALSQAWSDDQTTELNELGVQTLDGKAAFVDDHRLEITPPDSASTTLEADAFVVASGSVPIFPPNLKPDGECIIAPRFAGKLARLPASLIMIGGGVTGTEFVYAFNRLGVDVNWVVDEFGVLPPFDHETVQVLVRALASRDVFKHEGVAADSAEAGEEGVTVTLRDGTSLVAEMAFIAIGRRPDVAGLSLEATGLPEDRRLGIVVDEYCRSEVPHIYAAGDVTGLPMTANKAMAQGWIAGRHAAATPVEPYAPETMVAAVYTDPEVAQVGLSVAEARRKSHIARTLRVSYEAGLKPMLLKQTGGFVKLVIDADNNALLGASAVGAHASDVLAPLALGIRFGAQLDDLATLFAAHPGLGELAFAAARARQSPHFEE